MSATEDLVAHFDAMANHAAVAMSALGRERMDGALKRVEDMIFAAEAHGEGLVVIVAADFTKRHGKFL